jgi:L-rhamnose mutarotase
MMERRSFVLALKPGMKDEYVRRHDSLWPEMAQMLKDAGIRNYSIWWYRDRLFGYYECEDLARADAFKAQSPVQRRWSEYMADLISREEIDGAPVPAPELVFYLP